MARPADPNAHSALAAAARREFVKSGLSGARIEDITRACGLSKGAFYLHFESKEALFGELVNQLNEAITGLMVERESGLAAFFKERGAITQRDMRTNSPKTREFAAMEAAFDLRFLEFLWDFRDVFDVLVRGSQGTVYQGLVWQIAEMEMARVASTFDKMKNMGACRADISPEVCGAMVVGTYLLTAQQMTRMEKKPDLHAWVDGLQAVVRDGVSAKPAQPRRSSKTTVKAKTRKRT